MEAVSISVETLVGAHVQRISGTTGIVDHFNASRGADGTQAVQRSDGHQTPGRVEEWRTDRLLQFRDEWVRNRARDIQHAASISFNTCSEDTASITALNEFYRLRIFDRLKTEHCEKKELEGGTIQGQSDFGSSPNDVAVAEKPQMCRSFRREKSRRGV